MGRGFPNFLIGDFSCIIGMERSNNFLRPRTFPVADHYIIKKENAIDPDFKNFNKKPNFVSNFLKTLAKGGYEMQKKWSKQEIEILDVKMANVQTFFVHQELHKFQIIY
jgi:hypothetical protein